MLNGTYADQCSRITVLSQDLDTLETLYYCQIQGYAASLNSLLLVSPFAVAALRLAADGDRQVSFFSSAPSSLIP